MRAFAFACLAACGGTPAMMPDYTKVPEDKLDSSIQSSLARPDPEHKPTTKKGRREETMAAVAAAYLGMIFSKDDNASMGLQWDDTKPGRPHVDPEELGSGSAAPAVPLTLGSGDDFVPWIRLDGK